MSEEVQNMNPEESFRRLFWEQQLQAIHAKDNRQVQVSNNICGKVYA